MTLVEPIVTLLGYIIPFVFVLSIVVFFHELGHFLVGRWCGVKVDAFSLGFGPEIAAFVDRKGTRWRIAALPLGGYVKFHGDANGASMADNAAVAAMPASERCVTFFGQPVWKRVLIVAAGPVANFILAIVIFTGIVYSQGKGYLLPRVESVRAGEAAEAAGFKAGDYILSVDGHKIEGWGDMLPYIADAHGSSLTFVVLRNDKEVTLTAVPQYRVIDTFFGKRRTALIGLNGSSDPADIKIRNYNLPESIVEAASETWFGVERTVYFVGGLFSGRESADQISGPVGIARVSGEVAKIGFMALLNLAAILSISIGLINLVPVPLLDGGHLLYYALEAVRGRPISERAQELGFRVGLCLVMALMLFATFNDILQFTRS